MESYWISSGASRHSLPGSEDQREPHRYGQAVWWTAEYHLRTSWDRYSAHGAAGILYRDTIIRPLHDRFNAGERTLELLCAIRSI